MLWGKSGRGRERERTQHTHTVARETETHHYKRRMHKKQTHCICTPVLLSQLMITRAREYILGSLRIPLKQRRHCSLVILSLPRQAYVFRIAVSSSKHQCMHASASLRSQIDGASKDVQIFRRPSVWCRKRFSVALFPGKTFGGDLYMFS